MNLTSTPTPSAAPDPLRHNTRMAPLRGSFWVFVLYDVAEEIHIDKDLPSTVARYSREIEKKIIRFILEENQGNITKSATRLGISRKTLYEKIRRHDLAPAPDAARGESQ